VKFRIQVSPYAGGHKGTICYGMHDVAWSGRVWPSRERAMKEAREAMDKIVLAAKQWERDHDAKALAADKFGDEGGPA